jgi:hypothetical protein
MDNDLREAWLGFLHSSDIGDPLVKVPVTFDQIVYEHCMSKIHQDYQKCYSFELEVGIDERTCAKYEQEFTSCETRARKF